MRTKTVVKFVSNMTEKEYRQCKSLNFRKNGRMMYDLPMAKKHYPSSRVVMIKDLDNDKLIAWCLAYRDRGEFLTQYYVRVSHRRQGYGNRLMRHVNKFEKCPVVMPHDKTSSAFFKKHLASIKIHEEYKMEE